MADRPPQLQAYLATMTPEVAGILLEIRRRCHEALPGCEDVISYGMPALRLKKTFFFYAGFKGHIGIYPPLKPDAGMAVELADFANPKGNLRFPLARPVPFDLITRVAVGLARQSESKPGSGLLQA